MQENNIRTKHKRKQNKKERKNNPKKTRNVEVEEGKRKKKSW